LFSQCPFRHHTQRLMLQACHQAIFYTRREEEDPNVPT